MTVSTSTHSISAVRAAWLLIRLRLRRQWNQIGAIYRDKMGSSNRKAAGSPIMWVITAFVGLSMMGSLANLSYQGIANIEKVLGFVSPDGTGRDAAERGGGQTKAQPCGVAIEQVSYRAALTDRGGGWLDCDGQLR